MNVTLSGDSPLLVIAEGGIHRCDENWSIETDQPIIRKKIIIKSRDKNKRPTFRCKEGTSFFIGKSDQPIIIEDISIERYMKKNEIVYLDLTSLFTSLISLLSVNHLYMQNVNMRNEILQNQRFNRAIYSSNSNLTVVNSTFDSFYSIGGCGIYSTGENNQLIIRNSYFKNNNAMSRFEGDGAAIKFIGQSFSVTNSTFINNIAYNKGGSIYYQSSGQSIISDSNFIDNLANNSGGAIHSNEIQSIFFNNYFENNRAYQGGAINLETYNQLDDQFTPNFLRNNNFKLNLASNNGNLISILKSGSFYVDINFKPQTNDVFILDSKVKEVHFVVNDTVSPTPSSNIEPPESHSSNDDLIISSESETSFDNFYPENSYTTSNILSILILVLSIVCFTAAVKCGSKQK